jgi:hypothetical protein
MSHKAGFMRIERVNSQLHATIGDILDPSFNANAFSFDVDAFRVLLFDDKLYVSVLSAPYEIGDPRMYDGEISIRFNNIRTWEVYLLLNPDSTLYSRANTIARAMLGA